MRNFMLYTISSLAQGSDPKLLSPRRAGGLGLRGVSSHFGRALSGMGELALVRRLLGEDARADDGLAADERTEEGFLPAPPAALVVASSFGFGGVALEVDAIVILDYFVAYANFVVEKTILGVP